MKVLIIDDDPHILRLAQLGLEFAPGWQGLTASSPAIGLQLAVEHQPDAILLDLSFPDHDGLEVLAELKAQAATADIPVVLISADLGGLKAVPQAAGVLEKPFDPTELAESLSALLGWPPL